ncbi:TrbI/VirB10 family protein [Novosphingobium sp.]|jgi:type IV secretion system protein VirB10|uniref:TrbI/VirB10 family protein n=1 Tax=Novosphingobium sp. TaxID=1874826 RepID=UPI002FE3DFA1
MGTTPDRNLAHEEAEPVRDMPPPAPLQGEPREPGPPPPKVDPETLALRARPPRAIRFSKKAIIGLTGTAALLIAGTAMYALSPLKLHLAGGGGDAGLDAKAGHDALSTLPETYDKVPKLGPPLPGDLGRPILAKQREGEGQAASGLPIPQVPPTSAEPDQGAVDGGKAGQSGLFFSSIRRPAQVAAPAPSADIPFGASAPPITDSKMSIDFNGDPGAQQRKADFVSGSDNGSDVEPHVLVPAASPNMLSAGSVIAGSLITGLRSDLPGLVIAQVTQQVFDSATGKILLIPQGSRLIGSYDSLVAFGQKRALVVWQRIVMPNGSSIRLDNVPATDMSGYAGLEDEVDAHTWQIIKGAAISTLLGLGGELTFSGESDLVQAIRQSTQQNVSRAGDQFVSRTLQIQPTITIRPGATVRLVVHRDLVLPPWN